LPSRRQASAANPADHLGSLRQRALDECRQRFDFIIMDSAPVTPCRNAGVGQSVEAIVMVARRKTRWEVAYPPEINCIK
jgi:Mrp family chromosome partitioning ATPase